MSTHRTGDYLNRSGFHVIPPYETIAETADRLTEGERLKWPGSIAIHGFMRPMPKEGKRGFERAAKPVRWELVPVFNAERQTFSKEYVPFPLAR